MSDFWTMAAEEDKIYDRLVAENRVPKWACRPPQYESDSWIDYICWQYGKYQCPACGRPFFRRKSFLACHPAETEYEIWLSHQVVGVSLAAGYPPVKTPYEDSGFRPDPYPGGTFSAVGKPDGYYLSGSPYPGGVNSPVGRPDIYISRDQLQ